MKTIEKDLDSCNEFIFHNCYNIERIIELNQVRDCIFNILSKCNLLGEDHFIRTLGFKDDISVRIIDRNF